MTSTFFTRVMATVFVVSSQSILACEALMKQHPDYEYAVSAAIGLAVTLVAVWGKRA